MKLLKVFFLLSTFSLFVCGCCKRTFYEPNIYEKSLPKFESIKQIETLNNIDFKITHSKNDVYHVGLSKKNKERNYLKHENAVYYFYLFENNISAESFYQQCKKDHYLSRIFLEKKIDEESRYFIEYTEKPISSPDTFCMSWGYYESTATFKLQNLVVYLFIRHESKECEDLMNEINYFSEFVSDHFPNKQM